MVRPDVCSRDGRMIGKRLNRRVPDDLDSNQQCHEEHEQAAKLRQLSIVSLDPGVGRLRDH